MSTFVVEVGDDNIGPANWLVSSISEKPAPDFSVHDNFVLQGKKSWSALHAKLTPDFEWFESTWKETIPKGCGCVKDALAYIDNNPPVYDSPESWFEWTVRFHNAVNEKLKKPIIHIGQARAIWRDEPWIQPAIKNIVAVTSISPLPHHADVQRRCIQSWIDFGLDVVSGNTEQEILQLQTLYDNVRFVQVNESVSFPKPTPRVHDLMRLCNDCAVLLINSDIEILGDQNILLDILRSGKAGIGIKHTWSDHRSNAILERWGYDAFLLTQEQIKTFPDLDFAIGQPMWDWWIPAHLDSKNFEIEYIGQPYFYHAAHQIHWSHESLPIGRKILEEHYGLSAKHKNWERWRFGRPYSDRAAFGLPDNTP